MGIRGGMGLIEVSSDDRTRAGFLFGNEMTVSIDGAITQRIGRPGFGTTIEGGAASIPRKWAGSVITEMMSKLQGSAGRTGGLASQPNASQTNAALGDALPAQDAATLSQTINSIISGTEALNQIRVSDLGNTANQSRPYNDLPPPQDPQSPNPWTGKNGMGKHGQGGNHWQNKFYRYLCNCFDFTIPANLLLVEHLNATLRDQLKLAGFTERNIPIDQLTAVFKAWQIQQGRPGKRQGKGKGRNQLPAIPQLPQ